MFRLDLDLIRHALKTASDHGFGSVEVGLGDDRFEAKFEPTKLEARKKSASTLEADAQANLKTVTASAVGYYRLGQTPLQIGSQVNEGDVVAEIVALGLKNEVVAKWSGTVTQVLVVPEQAVEYGQALAILRTEP